ncbi:MAG: hypothetical protein PHQ01_04115 [Candidatus Pacebacteria bacterium]|nr:hypothetical protein [Candidatus Paceibacterota bacterium]
MINKHEKEINKIIEIGKNGICETDNLYYFLPNFPSLTGQELLFSNFDFFELSLDNIEYLIKGLHYIELEHRKETENEFGFGSPSKTSSLIYRVGRKDSERGQRLREWIANNGGNYYIRKI